MVCVKVEKLMCDFNASQVIFGHSRNCLFDNLKCFLDQATEKDTGEDNG